ncbi:nucleotide-diphospho-sugar transferase [Cladochytrium replicatum]|nr:nucleotide-diphospho-sugar transferase [Cladochytrium replicatum]
MAALFSIVLVLLVISIPLFLFVVWAIAPRPRPPTASEQTYTDPSTGAARPFPSILDVTLSTVDLSIIVPAFDESKRLPAMLDEAAEYLVTRKSRNPAFQFEIIVVDDGSRDNTSEVALKYAKRKKMAGVIRVMTLEKNRGKGGAVTQGMMVAIGCKLLFVDADGATLFSDIERLEAELDRITDGNGFGIAVGSRAHMVNSAAVVKRTFIRNFLMRGFHTILLFLGISSIKDTQCGFKLFTRPAARLIFPNMHEQGWIFDIELLLIAEMRRMPIAEVPVTWHEVEGSKMQLVKDSIRMLIDLVVMRVCYLVGFWRVSEEGAAAANGTAKKEN